MMHYFRQCYLHGCFTVQCLILNLMIFVFWNKMKKTSSSLQSLCQCCIQYMYKCRRPENLNSVFVSMYNECKVTRGYLKIYCSLYEFSSVFFPIGLGSWATRKPVRYFQLWNPWSCSITAVTGNAYFPSCPSSATCHLRWN